MVGLSAYRPVAPTLPKASPRPIGAYWPLKLISPSTAYALMTEAPSMNTGASA